MTVSPMLVPNPQAHRFSGISSPTCLDPASKGPGVLKTLWSTKPAWARRDMRRESTLDRGKIRTGRTRDWNLPGGGGGRPSPHGAACKRNPAQRRHQDHRIDFQRSLRLRRRNHHRLPGSPGFLDRHTTLGNHRGCLCGQENRQTRREEPQRCGKSKTRPASAFEPFIKASRALSQWYAFELITGGVCFLLVRRLSLGWPMARALCFQP